VLGALQRTATAVPAAISAVSVNATAVVEALPADATVLAEADAVIVPPVAEIATDVATPAYKERAPPVRTVAVCAVPVAGVIESLYFKLKDLAAVETVLVADVSPNTAADVEFSVATNKYVFAASVLGEIFVSLTLACDAGTETTLTIEATSDVKITFTILNFLNLYINLTLTPRPF